MGSKWITLWMLLVQLLGLTLCKQWDVWFDTTSCTHTCGGGVIRQTRECLREDLNCLGITERYRVCNTQACPIQSLDPRASQCAKFNKKSGKVLHWAPVYEDGSHDCSLKCKAKETGEISVLKDYADNGTPCGDKQKQICLHGKCVEIGCDKVVGSQKEVDTCQVCGGRNKDCYIIHRNYKLSNHIKGYNDIFNIPVGSTSIKITKYGQDKNDITLRNAKGQYFLNGESEEEDSLAVRATGTTFSHVLPTSKADNEILSAPGPTKSRISVILLIEDPKPELVVDIEYYAPIAGTLPPAGEPKKKSHHKTPKKTIKEYLEKTYTTDDETASSDETWNENAYKWVAEDWQDCSVLCGGGLQKRQVQCISVVPRKQVNDGYCRYGARMDRQRKCNTHVCDNFSWKVGEWQACSMTCGDGYQSRQVTCTQQGGGHPVLSDDTCYRTKGRKPVQTQVCVGLPACSDTMSTSSRALIKALNMKNCMNSPCWVTLKWSQCSSTCGEGQKFRVVTCIDGVIADVGACDGLEKPDNVSSCYIKHCDQAPPRCELTRYGCCPDGRTPAEGHRHEGCPIVLNDPAVVEPEHCNVTQYGCCEDGVTTAKGAYREGCKKKGQCRLSQYGCCSDGYNEAKGPRQAGCVAINSCLLPMKVGNCNAYLVRYFYDHRRGKCARFVYGGCRGNTNRFISRKRCLKRCSGIEQTKENKASKKEDKDVCLMAKDTRRTCGRLVTRWFHNRQHGTCQRFWYSNCGDRGNHFNSKEDCTQTCGGTVVKPATAPPPVVTRGRPSPGPINICTKPKPKDLCEKWVRRWTYNHETRRCERFWYGGCSEAGRNVFGKQYDCESTCGQARPVATRRPRPVATRRPRPVATRRPRPVATRRPRPVATRRPWPVATRRPWPVITRRPWPVITRRPWPVITRRPWPVITRRPWPVITRRPWPVITRRPWPVITRRPWPVITRRPVVPGSRGANCRANHKRSRLCGKEWSVKWNYIEAHRLCKKFWYNQCPEVLNVFESRKECESACGRGAPVSWRKTRPVTHAPVTRQHVQTDRACQLPKQVRLCSKEWVSRYWNSDKGCERFWYGGCNDEGNVFISKEECLNKCRDGPVIDPVPRVTNRACQLPKQVRLCSKEWVSRYWNSDKGCERFWYGGCNDEGNVFISKEECLNKCRDGPVIDPVPRVTIRPPRPTLRPKVYRPKPTLKTPTRAPSSSVCHLPRNKNRCKPKWVGKYFFDSEKRACTFYWDAGCTTEGNVFDSKNLCENTCRRSVAGGKVNKGVQKGRQNVCTLKKDTTRCGKKFLIWYFYDQTTSRCRRFWFGQCTQGGNMFETERECKISCEQRGGRVTHPARVTRPVRVRPTTAAPTPVSVCQEPYKRSEYCGKWVRKWFHNTTRGSCQQVWSGGCPNRGNEFESRNSCERKCSRAAVVDTSAGSRENVDIDVDASGEVPTEEIKVTDSVTVEEGSGEIAEDTTVPSVIRECSNTIRGCCPDGITAARDVSFTQCPAMAPTIESFNKEQIVAESGAEVRVRCVVKGVPKPRVVWYKNGRSLVSSESVSVDKDNTLVVTSVQLSDKGWYTCGARNRVNQTSRNFYLSVQVKDKKPIKKPVRRPMPSKVVVAPGESVRLDCKTSASRTRVTWYHNRQQVLNRARFVVNTTGTLHIEAVRVADAGTYTCRVEGERPGDSLTVNLAVESKLSAKITTAIRHYTQNGNMTLRCEAVGDPPLTLRWYLSGRPITTDHRVTIPEPGTLTVSSLTYADSGTYQCRVSNGERTEVDTRYIRIHQQDAIKGECKDKLSHSSCMLVVHARICGFSMYASQCCESCQARLTKS